MKVRSYEDPSIPADYSVVKPGLTADGTAIRPIDGDIISGYRLVRDI
jgi:hypothetical protein